jgi:hypothetical protein
MLRSRQKSSKLADDSVNVESAGQHDAEHDNEHERRQDNRQNATAAANRRKYIHTIPLILWGFAVLATFTSGH